MAASDTALWLHNKLGCTDDLWSGASICSQLTRDKLLSIHDCFHNLQPYVKVKLVLAFLHLPKRSLVEWKMEMEEILQLAADDTDQWVAMVADLLRTFPLTGSLNTDIDDHQKFFHDHLQELTKAVKKSSDVGLLPMECLYLGKHALMSIAGHIHQPAKHFALKRKPKSAALRAELLQKSVEAANNLKKNKTTCTIPIKVRSFAKKMDNTTPMKGIPNKVPPSGGFLQGREGPMGRFGGSTPIAGRAPTNKREGGIKLLDISEMPVGAREAKRRRKAAEVEAMEKAKKEKEAQSSTPDYAAGLVSAAMPNLTAQVQAAAPSGPTYTPQGVSHLNNTQTSILTTQQTARNQLQQQLQQQLSTATTMPAASNTTVVRKLSIVTPLQTALQPGQTTSTLTVRPQLQVMTQPVVTNPVPVQSQPKPAKKELSLTKDQMLEAQEMFKTSNKVTRTEKAFILGFMAGSRDNPCPQNGDVVNIRLSEHKESVQQPDGAYKPMMVDVFFQMNYSSGEWKRIKKYRPVEVDEDD